VGPSWEQPVVGLLILRELVFCNTNSKGFRGSVRQLLASDEDEKCACVLSY
jgi:hypothetical protein